MYTETGLWTGLNYPGGMGLMLSILIESRAILTSLTSKLAICTLFAKSTLWVRIMASTPKLSGSSISTANLFRRLSGADFLVHLFLKIEVMLESFS
jgi:hypothetical protein